MKVSGGGSHNGAWLGVTGLTFVQKHMHRLAQEELKELERQDITKEYQSLFKYPSVTLSLSLNATYSDGKFMKC